MNCGLFSPYSLLHISNFILLMDIFCYFWRFISYGWWPLRLQLFLLLAFIVGCLVVRVWNGVEWLLWVRIYIHKDTIIISKYDVKMEWRSCEFPYGSGYECLWFFVFIDFLLILFLFFLDDDSNDSNNAMMMIRFYSILVSFVEQHISLYYSIPFQLLFVSIIISRIMYHYRSLCSACRVSKYERTYVLCVKCCE